jgi:hypothetical protein
VGAKDIEDIYELSPLQQGMLLHSAHDGASDMYLSQQIYTADGPLNTEAFVRAWEGALTDHPALRTTFHWLGLDRPLQVVHRNVRVPVTHHDWSDVDAAEQALRLELLRTDDRAAGMDLTTPPLQRLHLIRTGPNRHSIVWTYHHLLMDGWSIPLFMNSLLHHYRFVTGHGQSPPAPPPPYRTYIAWLQRQDPEATKDFWRDLLAGVGSARQLPLAPAGPQNDSGPMDRGWARRTAVLPAPVTEALPAAAARHKVTVVTVLQAAWALVLRSYTGHQDVVFGCPSSGRPADVPDADRIVGVFANTMPLRVTVPDRGDPGPWLRDIQQTFAKMRRYEYTPLSDIKRWAGVPGQQLFQSLVALENYPSAMVVDDTREALNFRQEGIYDTINYPIGISILPGSGTIMLGLQEQRFPPGFIDDVLTRLTGTLGALVTTTDLADLASAAGPALSLTPRSTAPTTAAGGANPFERAIAAVFEEILDITDVDPTTSFFDLGGDSFDAVRAVGRIPGCNIGLLAANPSPRELANALATAEDHERAGATAELARGAS